VPVLPTPALQKNLMTNIAYCFTFNAYIYFINIYIILNIYIAVQRFSVIRALTHYFHDSVFKNRFIKEPNTYKSIPETKIPSQM
jgi:hypothetical protein